MEQRSGWFTGRRRMQAVAAVASTAAVLAVVPGAPATGQLPEEPIPILDDLLNPTAMPDRIVLNPTSDPATSQAVTWRTDGSYDVARAQIVRTLPGPSETRGGPRLDALADTVDATSTTPLQLSLGLSSRYHSVTFTDLEPSTSYLYRVGDGANWSEWLEFETAAAGLEPFSFIYYGDAQNEVHEHVSRVFRRAFSDKPDASVILHAGDLVNTADDDGEWGEWFAAAGWINGMRNIIATPGNHEYRSGSLSPQWRPQFTFPTNGPDVPELAETVYFLDYQGVRFISLDSNQRGGPQLQAQVAWLDQVLADNPNKWTVVTFHHPVFSVGEGRNEITWRNNILPVLEEHGVDLVLQGHDHSYGRGNVASNEVGSGRSHDGPVYVVSVSGPKMYEVSGTVWDENGANLRSTAENTQLYQLIDVDHDHIRFEARDATGAFHDGFVIRKQDNGRRSVTDLPDPS